MTNARFHHLCCRRLRAKISCDDGNRLAELRLSKFGVKEKTDCR